MLIERAAAYQLSLSRSRDFGNFARTKMGRTPKVLNEKRSRSIRDISETSHRPPIKAKDSIGRHVLCRVRPRRRGSIRSGKKQNTGTLEELFRSMCNVPSTPTSLMRATMAPGPLAGCLQDIHETHLEWPPPPQRS